MRPAAPRRALGSAGRAETESVETNGTSIGHRGLVGRIVAAASVAILALAFNQAHALGAGPAVKIIAPRQVSSEAARVAVAAGAPATKVVLFVDRRRAPVHAPEVQDKGLVAEAGISGLTPGPHVLAAEVTVADGRVVRARKHLVVKPARHHSPHVTGAAHGTGSAGHSGSGIGWGQVQETGAPTAGHERPTEPPRYEEFHPTPIEVPTGPVEVPPVEVKPPAETPPVVTPPTEETGPGSAPAAEPTFAGDFDSSGFGEWRVLQSLTARTAIVGSSPYQGDGDGRFEVREGDIEPKTGSPRTEVTGPTFHEGADLYIGDAIRVPNGYSFEGPWQLVQQLHDFGEGYGGSPGTAVFLENPLTLRLGPGDGTHTFWRSNRLEAERWYHLVYHVKLSRNPAEGFMEVWLDGAQQTLSNGQLREYGKTMESDEDYLKAGIYRSRLSTGTSIVEHDDITVGTTLASAMGG
jgi:hypothetical protein